MDLYDLDKLQFTSTEEIQERINIKLQALIKQAYNHVPYYRKTFDQLDMHWSDIRDVSDLRMFPVLSRKTVRDNFPGGLLSGNMPEARQHLTSTTGSTGVPLKFYTDNASDRPRSRAWNFLDKWAGVKPEYKRVWLGAPRPKPSFNPRHPLRTFLERKNFRQPEDLISVFMLRNEEIPGIMDQMQKRDPYFIYGVSSSIRFIASQIEVQEIAIDKYPRSIIGTSDTLLQGQMEYIQSVFQCHVYSRYGSYEMGGGVAQTCPDNSRTVHVIPELVSLEIVDDEGIPVKPGVQGRILMTDFTNHVMPFIRYDTGDVGVASGPCACGRGFPAISEIRGRDYEQVKTPSGDSIHGWEFEVYLFYQKKYKKYISEYEIIQKNNDVLIRVVPTKALTARIVSRLKDDLQHMVGDDMTAEVESVARIECGKNGKKPLIRIVSQ